MRTRGLLVVYWWSTRGLLVVYSWSLLSYYVIRLFINSNTTGELNTLVLAPNQIFGDCSLSESRLHQAISSKSRLHQDIVIYYVPES
eukprot:scaffold11583_cov45-Attheya_sp.AAC.2